LSHLEVGGGVEHSCPVRHTMLSQNRFSNTCEEVGTTNHRKPSNAYDKVDRPSCQKRKIKGQFYLAEGGGLRTPTDPQSNLGGSSHWDTISFGVLVCRREPCRSCANPTGGKLTRLDFEQGPSRGVVHFLQGFWGRTLVTGAYDTKACIRKL